MAVAAPGIDEIAVIAREVSRVGTSRIGKALHLSVLMSHVNLAVVRIELGSLEINIARLLIHSVDRGNIIVALLYLAQELAVHIIEIEMHEAVAVARQQDVLLAHDAVFNHLFLYKLRHTLLDEHPALAGERIDCIEAHVVLMAVHRINNQTVGVWRCLDAWIIAVGIYRHIERHGLAVLHIITPEAHLRVVLSCLRIFIGILSRIVVILAMGRMRTFEHLQRISLYVRFVEAYPSDGSSIRIPCKGAVEAELLFVNPIRNTIDHLIELTVAGNLGFLISIGNKEIVILYEGNVA